MCGIVGYIGQKSCSPILLEGLKKLEYRGYDSAGIAVLNEGSIAVVKSKGKLSALEPLVSDLPESSLGIGHTRWATHGVPSVENAHPHVTKKVALVHNGIIENYVELKKQLVDEGAKFLSETDTEVVLQLLVRSLKTISDPRSAIMDVVSQLKGAFSLGVMLTSDKDSLYLVKEGSPLVIGVGDGENFFASDALALAEHTQKAIFLNDGEVAKITEKSIELWDFEGKKLDPRVIGLEMSGADIGKQGFRHFMLKEIHEQPAVMASIVERFVDIESGSFDTKQLGLDGLDLKRIKSISIIACGTAYYASLLGKYFIEPATGIPVNVELASEFRYRQSFLDKSSLVIAVSQSGETADTLACVKYAAELGAQVFSICNVQMSSIPREADSVLYMEAGPEIGVASTKAFTSMIICQYLWATAFGEIKGRLKADEKNNVLKSLRALPPLLSSAVDTASAVEKLSKQYYEASDFLFLGRGTSYPVALEGALKLKEISYIHAEGYAGGELKHGPIALIDRHMPVVSVAPRDFYYDKMLSNIEEVKAREGRVIGLGASDDEKLRDLCESYISCPQIDNGPLQTILSTIPLQLLAYYVAVRRGTDVDQPRNLAKSVTVE